MKITRSYLQAPRGGVECLLRRVRKWVFNVKLFFAGRKWRWHYSWAPILIMQLWWGWEALKKVVSNNIKNNVMQLISTDRKFWRLFFNQSEKKWKRSISMSVRHCEADENWSTSVWEGEEVVGMERGVGYMWTQWSERSIIQEPSWEVIREKKYLHGFRCAYCIYISLFNSIWKKK